MSDETTPVPPLEPVGDPSILVEIARGKMPFGKYANTPYLNVPEPYLTWFAQQGWPRGRLGIVLATLHEIKINGLEGLVRRIGESGGFPR